MENLQPGYGCNPIKVLIIVEQRHIIFYGRLGDQTVCRLSYGKPLFSAGAIQLSGANVRLQMRQA